MKLLFKLKTEDTASRREHFKSSVSKIAVRINVRQFDVSTRLNFFHMIVLSLHCTYFSLKHFLANRLTGINICGHPGTTVGNVGRV